MAEVRLQGVNKSFGQTQILHNVDLQIPDGEFVVFVGPSGCGKSTLLRVIAGLEDITSGQLTIGGTLVNDIPPSERGISMVFQSYALYPHMNLFDNMAFGLKLAKTPKAEIDDAVHKAAKILNIDHLLQRKPKELSGGQRQRVAIGRAIVRQPKVFLFDEPLSNLDAALRVRMRYEFAKLHETFKTTMVYVTHDQVEAMTLADRIVVLNGGKVEQVGAPLQLYEHPINQFVAGFIGSPKMNFLPGTIDVASANGAQVRLSTGETFQILVDASAAKQGDKVQVGIRPEHLVVNGDENTLKAPVIFVERIGSTAHVYCSYPGLEEGITCEIDNNFAVENKQTLTLSAPAAACHLFADSGKAFQRLKAPAQRKAA
jgi:multiple sugar transport system ATP-binding protein